MDSDVSEESAVCIFYPEDGILGFKLWWLSGF
jgi:hypothetical protein